MRNLLILLVLLFSTDLFAATDIVATYKGSEGTMFTIVTRDKEHVRMDTSATSYMLMKENKIYSVYQDSSGQWMVMDMGKMMKTAASSGFTTMYGGGEVENEPDYKATFKKTGKKERIAGYTGVVYNSEVKENGRIVRRDEIVFCSHSDIKKVNEAWMSIAGGTGDILGEDMEQSMGEADTSKYGGILRYGDEMKLDSLKKVSLNKSYYSLPANAQFVDMGQMPGFNTGSTPQLKDLSKQYEQQNMEVQSGQSKDEYGQQEVMAEEEEAQSSEAAQVLNQDAKDVGDAARKETKDATIDEVKKGVRGIFNSIFD